MISIEETVENLFIGAFMACFITKFNKLNENDYSTRYCLTVYFLICARWQCSKHFPGVMSFSHRDKTEINSIISILEMRKLSLSEIRQLDLSHMKNSTNYDWSLDWSCPSIYASIHPFYQASLKVCFANASHSIGNWKTSVKKKNRICFWKAYTPVGRETQLQLKHIIQ